MAAAFLIMMVAMAAARTVRAMIMVMFPFFLPVFPAHLFHQLSFQILRPFDSFQDILPVQFIPRCRYNRCFRIMLPYHIHAGCQLLLADFSCPAQNDCSCIFYLVNKKVPEILDIHLAFHGIHYCHRTVQFHLCIRHYVLHRLHHIRKLPYSGRLYQNPFRSICLQYFF